MELDNRISVFLDFVQCIHHLDYWIYDSEGALLCSTSQSEHLLDRIFREIGCHEYMMYSIETTPFILSGKLDTRWIAVKQLQNEEVVTYHVLGPFLSSDTFDLIEIWASKMISDRPFINGRPSKRWLEALIACFRKLSVISSPSDYQYALMLHRLINDEYITQDKITHQPPPVSEEFAAVTAVQAPHKVKDRMNVYLAERALLHAIKEGDVNAAALSSAHAQKQVSRIREYTGNTLLDAQIACTTFTAICTRGAVEGGLSPSLAYPIGDSYIRKIYASSNVDHVVEIKTRMYNDFVSRVHELRVNPDYSKAVQSCCDYIQLHPAESLSIDLLANRLGYAKYYLSALFKKETGVLIGEYIKYTRIERAKVLLASTDLGVEDIWEAVGFSSRSVFSKAFRSVVGMTPREYRAQHITI